MTILMKAILITFVLICFVLGSIAFTLALYCAMKPQTNMMRFPTYYTEELLKGAQRSTLSPSGFNREPLNIGETKDE